MTFDCRSNYHGPGNFHLKKTLKNFLYLHAHSLVSEPQVMQQCQTLSIHMYLWAGPKVTQSCHHCHHRMKFPTHCTRIIYTCGFAWLCVFLIFVSESTLSGGCSSVMPQVMLQCKTMSCIYRHVGWSSSTGNTVVPSLDEFPDNAAKY